MQSLKWCQHCHIFSLQAFNVNDKVLASWSDCRFYPAKVISVNKDGEYRIKLMGLNEFQSWICY